MQLPPYYTYNISTHTPHARRDSFKPSKRIRPEKFQLTRLMRGVTRGRTNDDARFPFQLTRLMRGVTSAHRSMPRMSGFQLTRLMRGVTYSVHTVCAVLVISTHTPHARRDIIRLHAPIAAWISTHTPHARRDKRITKPKHFTWNFNSHASCEA